MHLDFPEYDFKIKRGEKRSQIFDPLRKKFVALTPEEFVRQHVIQHLHLDKGFPLGLMMSEQHLRYNGMDKRCDVVCYNTVGRPILLVECKAPSIAIDQKAFDQIAQYNVTLQVPYLFVTNGTKHYYCKINFVEKSFGFLKDLPQYSDY